MSTAVQSATLSEQLRRHLEAAPSKRRVAKQSGVDPATISRFRRGIRSITIDTADRLAGALGLSLK